MSKRENFNKKTREHFEAAGWVVETVEHYNPYSGRTNDFGGFADLIAYIPEREGIGGEFGRCRTVAIQACRQSHWKNRKRKILGNGRALAWLLSGNLLWVAAWEVVWVKMPDVRGHLRLQKKYAMDLHIIGPEDFKKQGQITLPMVEATGDSASISETNKILMEHLGS